MRAVLALLVMFPTVLGVASAAGAVQGTPGRIGTTSLFRAIEGLEPRRISSS